jgi:parallel beta-helix repeat protein
MFRIHRKLAPVGAAFAAVLAVAGAALPSSAAQALAAGTTLYVATNGADSNPGTAAQPFRTISAAAAAAQPGTTVSVAPGTYTQPVTSKVSGTASARIRVVSATKWAAKIQTSGQYFIWRNDASYVDIQDFDISAPDAHVGIENNGSYVRVLGNNVHNIASTVTSAGCSSNGGAGIEHGNYSATTNETSSNVVHDIGDYQNPLVANCWTIQGIYDSTPRGIVANNVVYHVEAFGIHLWHAATGNTVANNLVFKNGVGGIQAGAGDSPGGVTFDNATISNNIILDNPSFGIRQSGKLGTNTRFSNNLIWRNGSVLTQPSGTVTGTLSVDPQFVNYQPGGFAAGGDYHLRASSPAVNAGTSLGAPAVDIDGLSRQSAIDIGPYEYGATAPTPTPSPRTSIFAATAVPKVAAAGGGQPVELGLKFRSSTAGYISGVRFYKSSGNTGEHIGSLWSRSGQLLARATFSGETASGWQQVTFATPVKISANTTYVASYHTNTGNYAYDENAFASTSVTNGPLTALQNGVDGPNSVYASGANAFPTASYHATNYWVDVLFSTTP